MQPFYENNSAPVRFVPTEAAPFPEHLHAQVELTYLYSGRARMLIDRRIYSMEAGDLCLCFPGAIHGYLESEDAQAMMAIFSPSVSTDFSGLFSRHIPVNPLLRRSQMPQDVARCMEAIREECLGGHDERAMRGYLQVVLARTVPLLELVSQTPESPDIAYRILQYLAQHFTEPLSLAELSRKLGVSESHLSHTFSRRFRTGFRTYINALRLDHACTLLSATDASITQILYECGFECPRTFNRAFAEHYGVSPSEYRRSRRPQQKKTPEEP